MTAKTLDVTAIGNAIVDVLRPVEDQFLIQHGVAKGGMTLIDSYRAEVLTAAMQDSVEISGGSAANTAAGIASLGGHAAFIGKIKADRLGEVYVEDLEKIGVRFSGMPAQDGESTGRSLILVTPDGQRSMNTFLGCASHLTGADIDEGLIARSRVLYVEGYLWDMPSTKDALRVAFGYARKHGTQIALTLSDSFCVGRWRDEFLGLLKSDVDILFANENEAKSLFETSDFNGAFQAFRLSGKTVALTRSERGSVICNGSDVHLIDADPIDSLVDTTGAGDLFAAGFLYGVAKTLSLDVCGQLGSLCAAECVQHLGPRPLSSLRALAGERGLL